MTMMRMNRNLDLNVALTAEEASFVREHGLWGRMPYNTPYTRALVDHIARKLKLVKRFRGPRRDRSVFRYNECLKRDAVAVKLYRKMDYRRWGIPASRVVVDFFLDDRRIVSVSYFRKEIPREWAIRLPA